MVAAPLHTEKPCYNCGFTLIVSATIQSEKNYIYPSKQQQQSAVTPRSAADPVAATQNNTVAT